MRQIHELSYKQIAISNVLHNIYFIYTVEQLMTHDPNSESGSIGELFKTWIQHRLIFQNLKISYSNFEWIRLYTLVITNTKSQQR